MKLISTIDAAKLKNVTRQAIVDAVGRGALTGQKVGGCIVVAVNKKFEAWRPMKVRQAAGKSRGEK